MKSGSAFLPFLIYMGISRPDSLRTSWRSPAGAPTEPATFSPANTVPLEAKKVGAEAIVIGNLPGYSRRSRGLYFVLSDSSVRFFD
jgi:hypothetical protein